MALETLRNVKTIGGFEVLSERPKKENGETDWALFDEQRKSSPIFVDHDVNMISFRIQNGTTKDAGVNGCQVYALIDAARIILEGVNKQQLPCRENACAITKLDEALHWGLKTADGSAQLEEGRGNE